MVWKTLFTALFHTRISTKIMLAMLLLISKPVLQGSLILFWKCKECHAHRIDKDKVEQNYASKTESTI